MMLGFLLARAGVNVVVLEKHKDFLRDFRGDTIHPSTLQAIYELGLLERFLLRPHQELRQVSAQIGDFEVTVADFSHLPVQSRFVALMPQWDFLNFIAEEAKRYPGFRLELETEVIGLIEENQRVTGVRVRTPDGERSINADLVVGADGRHSTVRAQAGLEVVNRGAPIDVLWMRISREPADPERALGRVRNGRILVTIDRNEYWQCAYIIPKGGFDEIKRNGIDNFRRDLAEVAPFLQKRTQELKSWDDFKLLTVTVDHLRRWWKPGLLCIGDSAHAMSPVGGVGINLAIQDAIAAANILAVPLRSGPLPERLLRRVQKRRTFPTRMTQRLQVIAHKRVIYPALSRPAPVTRLPWPLRLLALFPALRRIPARVIGMGFRPEHVHSPELKQR